VRPHERLTAAGALTEDSDEPSVGDVINFGKECHDALEGLGRQLLRAGAVEAGQLALDVLDQMRQVDPVAHRSCRASLRRVVSVRRCTLRD
jgi:hypothetical protein